MSRPKQYFLVVDTETCNSLEEPLPYDIGYAITDRYGNIVRERSFIVAEIFIDMADVMKSAYYSEKVPMYWEDIKAGKRTLATFWNIRRTMLADMKEYKVKKVGAYNMGFDRRALDNLIRYVSKSFKRYFFPYGTEYFCIWNMACDVLLNRNSYVNFALENGFTSAANNILTSAECAYRYIKNKCDFIESHTGLEDVKIEVEIFAKCISLHKKMDTSINSRCWKKVQHKRKQIELNAVFN